MTKKQESEQSDVEKAAEEYVLADRAWRRLCYKQEPEAVKPYTASARRAEKAERDLRRAVLVARKARAKKGKGT